MKGNILFSILRSIVLENISQKWLMISLAITLVNCQIQTKKEHSQDTIHQIPTFNSPTNYNFKLAGTFGELRNSHYHAGIDIKTNAGVEGDAVLAAADGWLRVISAMPMGYGNALIIDHSGGISTVYGHLLRFNAKIDSLNDCIKMRLKSPYYSVNLIQDSIYIRQSDTIGYIGNSGSSQAPHLHFEIRKNDAKLAINPLNYSIGAFDTIKPVIGGIKVLQKYSQQIQWHEEIYKSTYIDHHPSIETDTIKVAGDLYFLGLRALDYMNESWNKMGVYSYKVIKEGELIYEYKSDNIGLMDSRKILEESHFAPWVLYGDEWYLMRDFNGSQYPFVPNPNQSAGVIKCPEVGQQQTITIEVMDYMQNKETIAFCVVKDTIQQAFFPPFWNTTNQHYFRQPIYYNDATFWLPGYTNYEKKYLDIVEIDSLKEGNNNRQFFVQADCANFYKPIVLQIPMLSNNKNWNCILFQTKGVRSKVGITHSENYAFARIYKSGMYTLYKDTIPPTIMPIQIPNSIHQNCIIKVKDDVLDEPFYPDIEYDLIIDNKFYPSDYDMKFHTIRFSVKYLSPGSHSLQLLARDRLCNEQEYKTSFFLQ